MGIFHTLTNKYNSESSSSNGEEIQQNRAGHTISAHKLGIAVVMLLQCSTSFSKYYLRPKLFLTGYPGC